MTEHLPCLSETVFVEVVMCASRLSSAGACNISVSTAPLTPRPKSSSHLKARYGVLIQKDHRCPAAGPFRGVGSCIDSRSHQPRRELGPQQCSAAERVILFLANARGLKSELLGECAARQFHFPLLAGGTIPFIRKYSTICP